MEVKVTLSQIVLALIQIVGYACTAMGIAYYFGRKVSNIEASVKHTMDKWDDLADEVKTLSNRLWDTRGRGGRP